MGDTRTHWWMTVHCVAVLGGTDWHWQVFTERGFVTRVLMASFDLGKLKELDEQLTKVLGDMQVRVTR